MATTTEQFTVFQCCDCGAFDWAPEEIVHRSNQCRGRRDVSRIEAVLAVPVARTPMEQAHP